MVHPPLAKFNYRGLCSEPRKRQVLEGSEESALIYFLVGAGAGCVFTGCDFNPCSTELGPPRLLAYTDNVIDVIMNATADQVVAFERALAAPRGPKAV